MQINKEQAQVILDAFDFKGGESCGTDQELILAANILDTFPSLNSMRRVLNEITPYIIIDGKAVDNTDKLTRLDKARRNQAAGLK